MIRLTHVVACSLLVLPAACGKEDSSAGGGAGTAGATRPPATPTTGVAVEQKDLKAEVAGKPMAPLYGVAQPNPAEGNSHRLTFSTRPLACATLTTVLADAREGDTFWIRAHEALRPDGTMTWAYGGMAFGNGGSAPSTLVALGGYRVDGTRVIGTLPAGVSHEGSSPGPLAVSGSFNVPICEPLPTPTLRDLADDKKAAVAIEAKGSTARVTIAGKRFDVKGATALVGRDGTWEVRLTERPHGCAIEVPADLVVGLRVGADETKLYLGGHWMVGSANVEPIGGTVKVDVKPGAGAVALTLGGAMDYTPADAPYKVELSGTVSATTCAVP